MQPSALTVLMSVTSVTSVTWIKWVREMIKDLGFPEWVERPTLTLTDNRNARYWANESMITYDMEIDKLIDDSC